MTGFARAWVGRMRAAMRRHIESGYTPGLVALVRHRGWEHVEAIGTASFDSVLPMRRDAIFRLASMTKPITAVGAMILVEERRVRLDDPVDEYLPELQDRKVLRTIESPLEDTVPATRPITLRDLLTFRAGYGEVAFRSPGCPLHRAMMEARLPLAEWRFMATSDEFMKRLRNLPLAHQPGERWLYHMGCEIVGVLIARASGQTLGSFLRERIFEPIGMNDTGFFVPEDRLERVPTCYGSDPSSGQLAVLDEPLSQFTRAPLFEAGAGGLFSTIDDMAAFGRMMLGKGACGHERILSRRSVELMAMDHLTPEQKAGSPFFPDFWSNHGWGLGLGVTTRRRDLSDGSGRFGWDGAFGTSWFVDSNEEMIGVLMTQRRPDALRIPALTLDFWTCAYQLIDP